jgi:hypothetical protein
MTVKATTHSGSPLHSHIKSWAKGADHIDVAVAYLGQSGLDLIDELLKSATVDLTVSLYLRGTRKRVLQALEARLSGEVPGGDRLRVRVARELDKGGFHGKLVRFSYTAQSTARLIVGSVNWTSHGLESAGEVSVVVHGDANEMAVAFPPLDAESVDLTAWATPEDPGPLRDAIIGYEDQQRFPGLDNRMSSRFWRISGVVDASEQLEELVEEVRDGTAAMAEGDGEYTSDSTFISPVGGKAESVRRRVAASVSVGDVVFEQALDIKKRDDRTCRVVGTWRGRPSGARLDRVVLFYEVLSDKIPEGIRGSRSGAVSMDNVRRHCPDLLAD